MSYCEPCQQAIASDGQPPEFCERCQPPRMLLARDEWVRVTLTRGDRSFSTLAFVPATADPALRIARARQIAAGAIAQDPAHPEANLDDGWLLESIVNVDAPAGDPLRLALPDRVRYGLTRYVPTRPVRWPTPPDAPEDEA